MEEEEFVYSLAPELGVEGQDDGVLLGGEAAVADVGAEVVEPAQPAALAAPLEPCMRRAGRQRSNPSSVHATSTMARRYQQLREEEGGGGGEVAGSIDHSPAFLGMAIQLPPLPWRWT